MPKVTKLIMNLSGKDLSKGTINIHAGTLEQQLKDNIEKGEVSSVSLKSKGDSITLSTIILTLITSGSLVALLNCLKVFFDKEKSISINIKADDGHQITIDAKNIDLDSTQDFFKEIAKIIDGKS